jgi:hypothetical protein
VNTAFLKEYREIVDAAGGQAAAVSRDVGGSKSGDQGGVNSGELLR